VSSRAHIYIVVDFRASYATARQGLGLILNQRLVVNRPGAIHASVKATDIWSPIMEVAHLRPPFRSQLPEQRLRGFALRKFLITREQRLELASRFCLVARFCQSDREVIPDFVVRR
jgi:hypothetical protein